MFACDVEHFLDTFFAVNAACGVVGVGDYDGAGFRRDFAPQVINVWYPPLFFDGFVGDWGAIKEFGVGNVGRIGWSWERGFRRLSQLAPPESSGCLLRYPQ